MKRMVLSLSCAIAFGVASVSIGSTAVLAQEQKKETKLSERTVRVIMGTAYAGIPESLPKPDGTVVKLDRSDPKKFLIPVEDARNIIVSAVLSARADLCNMEDLGRKHFESLMRRERARDKWTSYQMTYIDVLHATTGLYMTGSTAFGDDVNKDDSKETDIKSKYKCSDDERGRVKAAVENDIKKLAQAQ